MMRVKSGLNQGLRWRVGSAVHSCWVGNYERETQAAIARLTRPGDVCYDLGANAGFFTLAMARLSQPGGRVYAFEPLPANGSHLLHHLAVNRLESVTLLPLALGGADFAVTDFQMAESAAMGRLQPGSNSRLVCPCSSLDALVYRHGLAAPNLLKIDVEGAEFEVLQGAARVLREHRPRLVLALHGDERRCLRLLLEGGYELFQLDGATRLQVDDSLPSELIALPAASAAQHPA